MKTVSKAALERALARVKEQLAGIGPMRPGTLTRQYKDAKERTGAFWQASYTHQMKSRTEYVRPEHVPQVRREIREYQRFRKLMERWIELGLALSKLRATPESSSPSRRTRTRHS